MDCFRGGFFRLHFEALATRHDVGLRFRRKLELIERLYDVRLSKKQRDEYQHLLSWLMDLPKEMDEQLDFEVSKLRKEKKMAFETGLERIARKKGLEQGLEQGRVRMARESVLEALEVRFGGIPDAITRLLETKSDADELKGLLHQAIQTDSLETFQNHLQNRPPARR